MKNNKLTNAVFYYCAYDEETKLDIEEMIEILKSFVAENPDWQLVGGYVDNLDMLLSCNYRQEFNKMLEDASKSKFNLVIDISGNLFETYALDSYQQVKALEEMNVAVMMLDAYCPTYQRVIDAESIFPNERYSRHGLLEKMDCIQKEKCKSCKYNCKTNN